MINSTPHISSELERSLAEVGQELLTIASRSRNALAEASKGFLERDNGLCNAVIANDDVIDDLDDLINHRAMEVLLRFRPVAIDMRTTLSSLRLSNSFERIGDESVSIARRALRLNQAREHKDAGGLEPIMVKVRRHFEDAVVAYTEKDVELARETLDTAQQLHKRITEDIKQYGLTLNSKEENEPQTVIDLLMILRSLDNVVGNSEDVANEIIFLDEDINDQLRPS